MEIDGASNNSVNDIRDLRERVKYVPSGGRYKVYIIDETHMLSDAAFNALLKTLEEPPPHVIFVLATTAPKKIPATVLSRCQHLLFRRIPTSGIRERLLKISEAEGIIIARPAVEMIARAADGSMRDGLTILDQISSFSSDISETDVKDLLGITDFGLLTQLSTALIGGNREDILRISAGLADKGTDIRTFIRELVQFFRDLLVACVVKNPEGILDLTGEELDAVRHIISGTSEDHLTLMLSEIMKAELDIRTASSPRLAFEMSLMKISFLSEIKPLKEVLENIDSYMKPGPKRENTEAVIQKTAVRRPADNEKNEISSIDQKPSDESAKIPESSAPSEYAEPKSADIPPGDVTLTDEVRDRALKRMEPPLASKLSKANLRLTGDKLILTLNGGDSIFADSIRKNAGFIGNIFSEELGKNIRIEIETVKKRTVRKKDLKEEVMADPAIREVLELFDGRIVDVIPIKEGKE